MPLVELGSCTSPTDWMSILKHQLGIRWCPVAHQLLVDSPKFEKLKYKTLHSQLESRVATYHLNEALEVVFYWYLDTLLSFTLEYCRHNGTILFVHCKCCDVLPVTLFPVHA